MSSVMQVNSHCDFNYFLGMAMHDIPSGSNNIKILGGQTGEVGEKFKGQNNEKMLTKLAKICYFCQFYAEIIKFQHYFNILISTFIILEANWKKGGGCLPIPPCSATTGYHF